MNVPSMTDHADKLLRAHGHDPARLTRDAIIGAAFLDACYSARQWREHTSVAELMNDDEGTARLLQPELLRLASHRTRGVSHADPVPRPDRPVGARVAKEDCRGHLRGRSAMRGRFERHAQPPRPPRDP